MYKKRRAGLWSSILQCKSQLQLAPAALSFSFELPATGTREILHLFALALLFRLDRSPLMLLPVLPRSNCLCAIRPNDRGIIAAVVAPKKGLFAASRRRAARSPFSSLPAKRNRLGIKNPLLVK